MESAGLVMLRRAFWHSGRHREDEHPRGSKAQHQALRWLAIRYLPDKESRLPPPCRLAQAARQQEGAAAM
jgi:hypothetical protein